LQSLKHLKKTKGGLMLSLDLVQFQLITLLTAPVASGKTWSLLDLYRREQVKIIFISPLRALANEVYEGLLQEKGVMILGGKVAKKLEMESSRIDTCLNFLKRDRAMLITTIELLEEEFLDLLAQSKKPILFVFDEFHLVYQWGASFRPILHDRFLAVMCTGHPVLALTATLNDEIYKQLVTDLNYSDYHAIHLDSGNQTLKYPPIKKHLYAEAEKSVMENTFTKKLKNKHSHEVLLMFCSFREEVEVKHLWAKRLGYRSLMCVGGRVEQFQAELKNHFENKTPIDCIFSTLALSHGVNLPEISKVFINYRVLDYDLWLQMVGRGGRRGSDYEVYTMDDFDMEKFDLYKEKLKRSLECFLF